MPVLAGSLPYNPIPSVEPNVGVPSRYQDIQARPEAFGAQVGAAESQLGHTVGTAADTLSAEVIRRQELINQVASDVASNKYMEGKTKLFTGDPETGDTGFMGKSGEDAIKAFPEVSTALSKLRNDIRSTLQNPRQQVQFDAETRRLHAFALEEAGRHYDQQFKVYQGETNKAKYQNATTGLAQAIATDDSAAESAYIAKQMDAGMEELRLKGTQNSPDAVNAMQQKIRGDYVKMKVEGISQKNPAAAMDYLDKNRDALIGDEYNQLHQRYRTQAAAVQAQIDAGLIDGSQLSAGGALSDPRNKIPVIEREFAAAGIDPKLAVKVAGAEGLGVFLGDGGKSGGAFQLYTGGGVGNKFQADTGLDPLDPKNEDETIKYAARYIARNGWGEWNGAKALGITGFTGVGSKALDSGRSSKPPAGGTSYTAFGDSIAAHLIRKAGVGGVEHNFDRKDDSTAVAGWAPGAIENLLEHTPDSKIKDSNAVLSSGASNITDPGPLNNNELAHIDNQIKRLKDAGAKSVTLLGVGTAPFLQGRNAQLAQLAQSNGVAFAGDIGPSNVADDGIHAKNPGALMAQVARAQSAAPVAASPTPAVTPVAAGPDVLLKPIPKLDFPLPPLEQGELPDSQVPGMAQGLQHIMDTVPADDVVRRTAAVKALRQQMNMQWQNQQRTSRLHNEQTKAANDQEENNLERRMLTGQGPPVTVDEIGNNPYLTAEGKRTMTAFLFRPNMVDPPESVSKANTVEIMRRMDLPEDNADRLPATPESARKAYLAKQINEHDYGFIKTDLLTRRAAGNETLAQTKKELLEAVRPQIMGPHLGEGSDMLDANDSKNAGVPPRLARMYNFIRNMNKKIEDYQNAGKDTGPLFDSSSKEFLGAEENLKSGHYLSPMTERMTVPPTPNGGPVDLTKLTDKQLQDWVRTNAPKDIKNYDLGKAEALRRGIKANPEAPVR